MMMMMMMMMPGTLAPPLPGLPTCMPVHEFVYTHARTLSCRRDFWELNDKFGSREDLQAMIDALHDNEMWAMLDVGACEAC
jgi:hypothetical protein